MSASALLFPILEPLDPSSSSGPDLPPLKVQVDNSCPHLSLHGGSSCAFSSAVKELNEAYNVIMDFQLL